MDKYLEFVQETAHSIGKEFLLDCGEGRDWQSPDGEWIVEDLSGWLIDTHEAQPFLRVWEQQGRNAVWKLKGSENYLYFVVWSPNADAGPGEPPVTIEFRKTERYA